MEEFKDSDGIDKHPLWKVFLGNCLNFEMDEEN